jgi:arsenate reductase (thioredoxin)
MTNNNLLFKNLENNLVSLQSNHFSEIPEHRKIDLMSLKEIMKIQKENKGHIALNFICTHNSRRSHISQLLAFAACYFLKNKEEAKLYSFYSGGTEATAFNPRAINALKNFGFAIIETSSKENDSKDNPHYKVQISDSLAEILAFSKKYNDPPNPKKDYIAIMTCDHASENCPIVFGSDTKFNLNYKDPKESDETPHESETYTQRVEEIGREMLYLFQ